MKRPPRSRLDHPTAEDVSDTSGFTGEESRPEDARNRAYEEDLVRRTTEERDDTPRRYEQPADKDADPGE